MHAPSDSKILILEDDPRTCESLRVLLSSHGYNAQTSMNMSDALTYLRAVEYDLILLDLNIHNQCSFSVMDHITENQLNTNVIIVTGQQSERKAITALKKGAIDYLKKPYEPADLLESIQKILDIRHSQHNREQLQEIIISSRERYRSVVDYQNDFICRLDEGLRVTFINQIYAKRWKSTPKEMIGLPFKNLVDESIYKYLWKNLNAIRSGSKLLRIEFKTVDSDTHPRWQQWKFRGILDEGDRMSEIQCIGRDVTRSKLHMKAAIIEKERYRQLAEMTSDWLWEIDREGFYTYASPVVYDLLGYRPEEVIGKKPFDFMPSEEAARTERIFQKAVERGTPLKSIENVNLHKNGEYITLETSGVAIRDVEGQIIGYRGIDRNISARKLAEKKLAKETAKLKQALKEVKRLSGMLPICSSCKRIRDDNGYWNQIEAYISDHSDALFSHGLCPNCLNRLYPDLKYPVEGI